MNTKVTPSIHRVRKVIHLFRGAESPEAYGILVLEHTFLRCVGASIVVADMTEATGQPRTFDTAAILSVND